jgi:hypothetical protein
MRKHRFDGNVVERLILGEVAGALSAWLGLGGEILEVGFTVTAEAVGDGGDDVAAASEAFRRRRGDEFSLRRVLVSCDGILGTKW